MSGCVFVVRVKPGGSAAWTLRADTAPQWGLASVLQSTATGWSGLMACRFFLGVAEAGFGTATALYYSCEWKEKPSRPCAAARLTARAVFYPKEEIGFRFAIFLTSSALGSCIAGSIAYGIQQTHSAVEPWRLLCECRVDGRRKWPRERPQTQQLTLCAVIVEGLPTSTHHASSDCPLMLIIRSTQSLSHSSSSSSCPTRSPPPRSSRRASASSPRRASSARRSTAVRRLVWTSTPSWRARRSSGSARCAPSAPTCRPSWTFPTQRARFSTPWRGPRPSCSSS